MKEIHIICNNDQLIEAHTDGDEAERVVEKLRKKHKDDTGSFYHLHTVPLIED